MTRDEIVAAIRSTGPRQSDLELVNSLREYLGDERHGPMDVMDEVLASEKDSVFSSMAFVLGERGRQNELWATCQLIGAKGSTALITNAMLTALSLHIENGASPDIVQTEQIKTFAKHALTSASLFDQLGAIELSESLARHVPAAFTDEERRQLIQDAAQCQATWPVAVEELREALQGLPTSRPWNPIK